MHWQDALLYMRSAPRNITKGFEQDCLICLQLEKVAVDKQVVSVSESPRSCLAVLGGNGLRPADAGCSKLSALSCIHWTGHTLDSQQHELNQHIKDTCDGIHQGLYKLKGKHAALHWCLSALNGPGPSLWTI